MMKTLKSVKTVLLTLIFTGLVSGHVFADQMQKTMMHQNEMKGQMHDEANNGMQGEMMSDMRTGMLSGSDDHHAAGTVAFKQEMGKDLLLLSGIKVEKVPDGHVYLARNGDRTKGVDLGILKKFKGDVTFALPAGTNPAAYDSVIIYCEKYDVEIGRAPLHSKM